MKTGACDSRVLSRLKKIQDCSRQQAVGRNESHSDRLFEMIRHHCAEIENLRAGNNPHWRVETGDLIVLCMELLLDAGVSPEIAVETSLGRFEKKLFPVSERSDEHKTSF